MIIAGVAQTSQTTFLIINPANEQEIAQAPQASKEQVNEAVLSANEAFKTWQKDENYRRNCLKIALQRIEKYKDNLANILTQEQGKPLSQALSEVDGLIEQFQDAIHFEIPETVILDKQEVQIKVLRKPFGVVAIITPWNFPLWLTGKLAFALVLGNTVVLKPSPHTPLSTLLLGEIICDAFPAGVLNVISGDDEVGALLTKQALVRHIAFTGSVETGKKIAHVAAADLKRVTLELGGNDPAIVLKDANPKLIAERIFWGAFSNTGQICTAIKRLYVHESLYEALTDKLIEIAKQVKIGDGLDPTTTMGPINNLAQLTRIETLVADAKQKGAEILIGGERLKQAGYFYPPTLVSNIKEGTALVDEEQFGPVLPIITFKDEQEAIERANGTQMGLGASVWSSNEKHATQIARQLESGIAWVNHALDLPDIAPFGGCKWSGIGRQGTMCWLETFTEPQSLSVLK
ncbi:MAG: aldehyde dehydrogenase family protein [Gammaproteobacteria bacterium]